VVAPKRLDAWLEDPFLGRLYHAIRVAGPIRSIALDLTDVCNLRCAGCYFFADGMDEKVPTANLDAFVAREAERGTNFVTVVGGEPSLALERLKVLYDAFRLSVATNGLRRIPRDGFEDLPIGVSVWGDEQTDRELRGSGRTDVFARALRNYAGDERAFWYYALTAGAAGHPHEVDGVVQRCIDNGNRVLFNFYGDVEDLGGEFDHRRGFGPAREAIERAIERHPESILMTSRLAEVVSTGRLFAERWGHAACASITPDHPANRNRVRNGRPFDRHFRAYNADLETTRRCCTAIDRDCDSCFDTWQHFSWVMMNPRAHFNSKHDFTAWLTTTWLFYFINRLVDVDEGARLLPEVHRRTRAPELAHTQPPENPPWTPNLTSSWTAPACSAPSR
jgi:hypothetical protein